MNDPRAATQNQNIGVREPAYLEIVAGVGWVEEVLTGAETILLVEDESLVRGVASEVLQWAGYRVLAAKQAAEAMLLYDQNSSGVDLLIAGPSELYQAMPQPSLRKADSAVKSRRPCSVSRLAADALPREQ